MYKIIFLFSFVGVCYSSVGFEKYFKVCNRNDEHVNACMKDAVSNGIKTLVNGIEELDIPTIDPFFQKEYTLEYNVGPVETKVNMKNIYATGIKHATVTSASLKANDDAWEIEIHYKTPTVITTGEYDAEGKFSTIRLFGSGDFNCTMSDVSVTYLLKGVPEKKGDETYIRVESFTVTPELGNMVNYLTNNNKESQTMSDLATKFINDHWRTIYKEFLPIVQQNWNEIGVGFASKVFNEVPYEIAFPIK
ncbi:hypothetical protein K1T71_001938 [Dendrolimus kikuchii]|uniref:Uncharacterized protein n=1 Tax=Dendrolimus kikuchii TaxID=765133 RepID=A0ACC1DF27_9NEOP|nr:hypothetical protein K1T71_001938 [Dendrolimus kikuchii]